jgi:hypothetical protein
MSPQHWAKHQNNKVPHGTSEFTAARYIVKTICKMQYPYLYLIQIYNHDKTSMVRQATSQSMTQYKVRNCTW